MYLTGAGHVAAGLAILFGVLPRLAAVLEAAQITAFVILAHIPAVFGAPRDRVQWGDAPLRVRDRRRVAGSSLGGPPSWLTASCAQASLSPGRGNGWTLRGRVCILHA